jgi:mRNA interferase MazF
LIRRGEIYWLELPPGSGSEQTGRRPVLIIQNDAGNQFSSTTIVVAITSQSRRQRYPFHVPFTADEGGLSLSGIVMCEQVQTVDQRRLGHMAGTFSDGRMREVEAALRLSLGLG